MSLTGIKTRSAVVQHVRQSLLNRGYEEYVPQLMTPDQPIEPTIYPFSTQWDRNHQTSTMYLATSPEGYIKQILASGGVQKCFSISHAFRNLEGVGEYHRPEFLMAEWYQQHASWLDMMQSTQGLVQEIWQTLQPQTAPTTSLWSKISLRDLWSTYEKCDFIDNIEDDDLTAFAQKKGYTTTNATWEQLFYQIVFNDLEPHYPKDPFFLIDFPSRVSPLAKPQSNQSLLAERFELIINRVELANGNTENTDTANLDHIVDQSLISSLNKMKTSSWAGVGLGIDRLAMLIADIADIHEIQWP